MAGIAAALAALTLSLAAALTFVNLRFDSPNGGLMAFVVRLDQVLLVAATGFALGFGRSVYRQRRGMAPAMRTNR